MALPWAYERDLLRVIRSLPGGFLPTYVQWAMNQTDAPLLYHVVSGFSLLSAVIPSHMALGGRLPEAGLRGNLYAMLVGRQGIDRKSTSIKHAKNILEDGVPGRRGTAPGSPQGLIQGLIDKPQQLLIYEDMIDLFAQTQQRKGGNFMSGLKGKLLPLYDCDAGAAEKQLAKQLIRCENPRLSILGGANRPILDVYVDPEDWTNGLTSRFIIGYAHKERELHYRTPNPLVRDWLCDWLGGMAALADTPAAWGINTGLTPGAHRYLQAFSHAVEITTPVSGAAARQCGPRARVRTQALKMAMLLGVSTATPQGGPPLVWPPQPGQQGQDWFITEPIMRVAIRLALICFAGALAITATATDSQDMRQRQDVLNTIDAHAWTKYGDVLLNGRVLDTKCSIILRTLKKEGTIMERMGPDGKQEFKRTGRNSHDLGVQEAITAVGAIVTEYGNAVRYGIPSTAGLSGGIILPMMPGTSPSNGRPVPASTAISNVPYGGVNSSIDYQFASVAVVPGAPIPGLDGSVVPVVQIPVPTADLAADLAADPTADPAADPAADKD